MAHAKGDITITKDVDGVGILIAGTDTHVLTLDSTQTLGVKWSAGSGAAVAGGQIGYAEVITSQTDITTIVDLTGLTTTVTVGTGRRIKITGFVGQFTRTAGTTTFTSIRTAEGATQLQSVTFAMANTYAGGAIINILTPSPGSHTYKLRALTDGTVTMEAGATTPCFILVEDIGAA